MRATLFPWAHRAVVSIMAKGCIVAASEVFLIFTTQLYQLLIGIVG